MAVRNGLRVGFWNAQSIGGNAHKKLDLLRDLLETASIDILGISETSLEEKHSLHYNKFHVLRYDYTKNRGLAVIYKKELEIKEIKSIQRKELELTQIEVLNTQSKKPINVTFLHYKPWNTRLSEKELSNILEVKEQHLILGDFNSKSPRWDRLVKKADGPGKILEEVITENNLTILNDKTATRHPQINEKNMQTNPRKPPDPSVLDLAITNAGRGNSIKFRVHGDDLGSDHCPIIIETDLDIRIEQNTGNRPLRFNYSKANWDQYLTLTESTDWNEINDDNIEKETNNLIEKILEVAKECITSNENNSNFQKKQRVLHPNKKPKLTKWWYTKECQAAKNKKKKALNRYQRQSTIENLREYNKARNECTNLAKRTKRNGFKDFANNLDINANAREVWNGIARLEGKGRINSGVKSLVFNDRDITTDQEKAEVLANQFQEVSSNENLDEKFKKIKEKTELKHKEIFDQEPNNDSYMNKKITYTELKAAIKKKKKKNSSPGEDAVTNELIRNAHYNLKRKILDLFNRILESGNIPKIFKKAIVAPVPKPNKDKSNPNNYRPISLTSHLGKLLERIINRRLQTYLKTNKILNPNQSGFLSKRQCLDQIMRLDQEAREGKALSMPTHAAFLDLEKAFDKLWRGGLLIRLKKIGITGQIYNYIQDFLKDRSFKVKVGNCYSEPKNLDNGVPQGSVISPLLFNIMIDQIKETIDEENRKNKAKNKIKLGQYADDIALWYQTRQAGFSTVLSKVLVNIFEKLESIGFKVNKKKTQLIVLFPGRKAGKTDEKTVKVGNEEIPLTKTATYLGILLDTKLTYAEHTKKLAERANKTLNAIRYLSGKNYSSSFATLRTLYMGAVRSKITYGQEVYHSGTKTAITNVEKVQNRALRSILKTNRSTNIQAMEVVAKVPPLKITREIAINSYWTKVREEEEHPLKQNYEKHNNPIGRTGVENQPSAIKNKAMLKNLKLNETKIAIKPNCEAPWLQTTPECDISLTKIIKKKETNIVQQKIATMAHIDERYKNYQHAFTDGSKKSVNNNEQTASGAYIPKQNIKIGTRLDNGLSVMSTELHGIKKALEYFDNKELEKNAKIAIFTDSLSSVQAIEKPIEETERTDIIKEITRLTTKIKNEKEATVTIVWIPSHCDITGNEIADQIANKSTEINEIEEEIGMTTSETKALFKRSIYEKVWKKEYLEGNSTTKKYYQFKDQNIADCKTTGDRKLKRLILNRPFKNETDCLTCDRTNTHTHVILFCKKFEENRNVLRKRTGIKLYELEDLLNPEARKKYAHHIKSFLTSITETF